MLGVPHRLPGNLAEDKPEGGGLSSGPAARPLPRVSGTSAAGYTFRFSAEDFTGSVLQQTCLKRLPQEGDVFSRE